MAKKAAKRTMIKMDMTSLALLLIGVVLTIEAVALMSALSLMDAAVIKTVIIIGWAYAMLKVFAGIVSIYVAVKKK